MTSGTLHATGRAGGAAPHTKRVVASDPSRDPAPLVHIVHNGESLWAIAKQHLGADASNTRIATMVNELWRLNSQRIATGNPNLIYPGQQLRMP